MSEYEYDVEHQDARLNLSKRLRKIREEEKISQRKLAEMTNLAPSTIAELERGTKNTSIDTLSLMANALKIPVWKLLKDPNVNVPDLDDFSVSEKKTIHRFLSDVRYSIEDSLSSGN